MCSLIVIKMNFSVILSIDLGQKNMELWSLHVHTHTHTPPHTLQNMKSKYLHRGTPYSSQFSELFLMCMYYFNYKIIKPSPLKIYFYKLCVACLGVTITLLTAKLLYPITSYSLPLTPLLWSNCCLAWERQQSPHLNTWA